MICVMHVYYVRKRLTGVDMSTSHAVKSIGSTSLCVKQALKKDAAFFCTILFSADTDVRYFTIPAAQVKQ